MSIKLNTKSNTFKNFKYKGTSHIQIVSLIMNV